MISVTAIPYCKVVSFISNFVCFKRNTSGNGGNGDARVPTVGKTIINNPHPTKRVYEHGIQQPNFPHDPQHIRQLLQEALSIIRNQYEGRRDFLSAPIIPLGK